MLECPNEETRRRTHVDEKRPRDRSGPAHGRRHLASIDETNLMPTLVQTCRATQSLQCSNAPDRPDVSLGVPIGGAAARRDRAIRRYRHEYASSGHTGRRDGLASKPVTSAGEMYE